MNKKKLIGSVAVITLAVAAFVGGTGAYFSDTETSEGNVLAAGAIDLKIDNHSYYNGLECKDTGDGWKWYYPENLPALNDSYLEGLIGTTCTTSWNLADLDGQLFFDFKDLKPGDWGEDTISAHVTNNDSWLCMDIDVTETLENEINEPERKFDQTGGDNEGELQDYLNFVWWADDGDNVLEVGETVFKENVSLGGFGNVALADSTTNIWNDDLVPGPIKGSDNPQDSTYYIGKAWCFGNLTVLPVEQGNNSPSDDPGIRCNGNIEDVNKTQTDSVKADVNFIAIQSRNNEKYVCPTCEVQGDGYAGSVVSYNPGTRKDGLPISTDRDDPAEALGAPDGTVTPVAGGFVSLGKQGVLVLQLQSEIIGSQLQTLEISGNRTDNPAHVETALVEVSADGTNWFELGTARSNDNGNGITYFDVSSYDNIKYVRFTDTTDFGPHTGDHEGYDVDAVVAVMCLDEVREVDLPKNL